MALIITVECINGDVCEPVCPNGAIGPGRTVYRIDPSRCTECVGRHAEPQGRVLRPVDCMPQDPDRPASRYPLLGRIKSLQATGGRAGR